MENQDNNLKKEFKEKTVGYITAAFGLVAGLAWNDAIKAFIEKIFPLGNGGIAAKFVYAGIVTVLLVIATNYLVRKFANKD